MLAVSFSKSVSSVSVVIYELSVVKVPLGPSEPTLLYGRSYTHVHHPHDPVLAVCWLDCDEHLAQNVSDRMLFLIPN